MRFRDYMLKKDKKLIDEFGPYKVFTVDGHKVREINKTDHEFGDFSVHQGFPDIIPKNEIWIDKTVKPNERKFFITNALYRLKLLKKGMPYDKAYNLSLKKEHKMREIVDGLKFKPHLHHEPADQRVYVKIYIKINDVKIWLVNAEIVRDLYRNNFIEGGHFFCYRFIPENEIWIDNVTEKSEIPEVILHEYTEMFLMKEKKLSYDKAHNIAAKIELGHENDFHAKDVGKLADRNFLTQLITAAKA